MPLLLVALFSYKKEVSSGILIFLFVPLFLLSAMRYDIGRDYSTYMLIFENPYLIGVNEKGYMLINNFANKYNLTLQFVIVIYSMLTLLFAFLFIYENSKNKILSLFIFYTYTPFYLQTLNTLRQELAIYIFMYATKYIRRKEFLKYCILVIFAAVFAHNSVIIILPLYFFLNRKYKLITKILIFVFFLLISKVLNIIVQTTPYAIYLRGVGNESVLSPIFLLDVILCATVFLFSSRFKEKLFCNISFISFCILIMGIILRVSPVFVLVSRINEFFLVSLVITIPDLITKFKKYRNILYFFCLVCFFAVFCLSMLVNGVKNQLVPYQTFFCVFHNGCFFDVFMIFTSLMIALTLLFFNMGKNYE